MIYRKREGWDTFDCNGKSAPKKEQNGEGTGTSPQKVNTIFCERTKAHCDVENTTPYSREILRIKKKKGIYTKKHSSGITKLNPLPKFH